MAQAEVFQPHRFRTAARHYLAGRPPYAPRLIRLVAELLRLSERDRLLDLGCGPGVLAGAFAPLVGAMLAGFLGWKLGRAFAHTVTIASVAISFAASKALSRFKATQGCFSASARRTTMPWLIG